MAVPKKYRNLSRREVRYRLYRIQSGKIVNAQDGIKKFFESQTHFDGWHNFAITWDVGEEDNFPEGHWLVIKRRKSVLQEWEEVVAQHVQEFPVEGELQ